ncbi:Leucine rich repeat protein [Entamoeba marina]
MRSKESKTNLKLLDSYSILITSKYLEFPQDFINLICVNSKFKETTEKLRFNPIPIKSLKLFPKIQTQYLYSEFDRKLSGIDRFEIWYEVNYDQYLKFKEDNIKCHRIIYTYANRLKYGDVIPGNITKLGDWCFNNCKSLATITVPSTVSSLGIYCFSFCNSLKSINLSNTLTSFGDSCFFKCSQLKIENVPSHCFSKLC